METVLLIALRNYTLYLILSHFAVIPLMVSLSFGKCKWKIFLTKYITCYVATLLLGGCAEAIENTLGIRQLPFLAMALGVLMCFSLLRFFQREKRIERQLLPVELEHNGKKIRCMGLMDTGNLLREPMKNAPVSILKEELLKSLDVKEKDRCGIVLYQSLGKNDGALETYCIDRLSMETGKNRQQISPAIVAAAPAQLLQGKCYEVILNSELF